MGLVGGEDSGDFGGVLGEEGVVFGGEGGVEGLVREEGLNDVVGFQEGFGSSVFGGARVLEEDLVGDEGLLFVFVLVEEFGLDFEDLRLVVVELFLEFLVLLLEVFALLVLLRQELFKRYQYLLPQTFGESFRLPAAIHTIKLKAREPQRRNTTLLHPYLSSPCRILSAAFAISSTHFA